MNINKQDAKFRNDLIKLISESNLPAAMIRHNILEILSQVENAYYADVNAKEDTEQEQSEGES